MPPVRRPAPRGSAPACPPCQSGAPTTQPGPTSIITRYERGANTSYRRGGGGVCVCGGQPTRGLTLGPGLFALAPYITAGLMAACFRSQPPSSQPPRAASLVCSPTSRLPLRMAHVSARQHGSLVVRRPPCCRMLQSRSALTHRLSYFSSYLAGTPRHQHPHGSGRAGWGGGGGGRGGGGRGRGGGHQCVGMDGDSPIIAASALGPRHLHHIPPCGIHHTHVCSLSTRQWGWASLRPQPAIAHCGPPSATFTRPSISSFKSAAAKKCLFGRRRRRCCFRFVNPTVDHKYTTKNFHTKRPGLQVHACTKLSPLAFS